MIEIDGIEYRTKLQWNQKHRTILDDQKGKGILREWYIDQKRDTPTRVLANGRGFLRHGRTPQRAITSPLHPVTSLPLSRPFCGCLF